jgi:hypothetical protein
MGIIKIEIEIMNCSLKMVKLAAKSELKLMFITTYLLRIVRAVEWCAIVVVILLSWVWFLMVIGMFHFANIRSDPKAR